MPRSTKKRATTRTVEQPHGSGAGPGYLVRMNAITIPPLANRRNTRLAAVVDYALAICNDHGARAAARFLDMHGAGFALTVRVLREPTCRRHKLDFAAEAR